MANMKVTQVRGVAGQNQNQRMTLKGLGLRRRHHSVVIEDTPSTRGMVNKVIHLLKVEEVEE